MSGLEDRTKPHLTLGKHFNAPTVCPSPNLTASQGGWVLLRPPLPFTDEEAKDPVKVGEWAAFPPRGSGLFAPTAVPVWGQALGHALTIR